jgi:bacterioferritin-associated ferredoxin
MKWKTYSDTKRAKRRSLGLCIQCGHPREELLRTKCLRCVEKNATWSKETLANLKQQIILGYGGKCACCGETTREFLSLDHVIESRSEEKRRRGVVLHCISLYRSLIRAGFPPHFQILCFNCNCSLGFFGYCPHHPEICREIRVGKPPKNNSTKVLESA